MIRSNLATGVGKTELLSVSGMVATTDVPSCDMKYCMNHQLIPGGLNLTYMLNLTASVLHLNESDPQTSLSGWHMYEEAEFYYLIYQKGDYRTKDNNDSQIINKGKNKKIIKCSVKIQYILIAVACHESQFNPRSINEDGVAKGLYQERDPAVKDAGDRDYSKTPYHNPQHFNVNDDNNNRYNPIRATEIESISLKTFYNNAKIKNPSYTNGQALHEAVGNLWGKSGHPEWNAHFADQMLTTAKDLDDWFRNQNGAKNKFCCPLDVLRVDIGGF